MSFLLAQAQCSLLFSGVNVESIQNHKCGWELWRFFFFFLIRISKSWLKTGNDTSGTAAFLGCWWCLRTSPRSWLSHTWLEFLLFSGEKFQTSTVGKFWSILYLQADFAFCVGLKNYGSERTDANDHPWPLRNEIFKHNIKSTLWLQGWFRWGHNFFTWAVVYEEQEKE